MNTSTVTSKKVKSNYVITELAELKTVTSNENIINIKTTTKTLVDNYVPQIFKAMSNIIDVEVNNDNDNNVESDIQSTLYTISSESQQLIENLEDTLTERKKTEIVSDDEDNINRLAQDLIDYATSLASAALSQSEVGEPPYVYKSAIEYRKMGKIKYKKVVTCSKFDASDTNIQLSCGYEAEGIVLSPDFVSRQRGIFDCAFMSTIKNDFIPKHGKNRGRKSQSNSVTINVYNGNNQKRRLQTDIIEDTITSECFPYLITLNNNNNSLFEQMKSYAYELKKNYRFPSCDFWNVSASEWDTSGCVLYDITNETMVCACTHLTTFSMSSKDLVPEAYILTEIDWRQMTYENIMKYPTVTITIAITFAIIMILCLINPRSSKIDSKSILSFQDIIYKSVKQKKMEQHIAGKEIKYIEIYMPNQHEIGHGIKRIASTKEARHSLCQLQWKLFKTYLRNDHTLLSIFQRTAGTVY